MTIRRPFLAVLGALVFGLVASPAYADPVPTPAICADAVGALGTDTCAAVTKVLKSEEQKYGAEIAVLVVDSTDGQSIESYAQEVFNSWGIGKKSKNNGVLLVVSMQDRELRIEVGGGLTGKLSDGRASEIVSGIILPQFKTGDYRLGILMGLDSIRADLGYTLTAASTLTNIPVDAGYTPPTVDSPNTNAYDDNYAANAYSNTSESSDSGGSNAGWILALLFLVAIAVVSNLVKGAGGGSSSSGYGRRSGFSSYRSNSSRSSSSRSSSSRSSSSRSSSSRSSRSSGFGGGRSSGGGASGKW